MNMLLRSGSMQAGNELMEDDGKTRLRFQVSDCVSKQYVNKLWERR